MQRDRAARQPVRALLPSDGVPGRLTHKIKLFRKTGRVFRKNEELFSEKSWVQVMMGQGIIPKAYHPIAEKLRDDELTRFLLTIRDDVTKAVAALPGHAAYVARYCGAADEKAA